jgi:hypothetical protein
MSAKENKFKHRVVTNNSFGISSAPSRPVAGLRVIIWETNRKIASPMLQDKLGGTRKAAHFFDIKYWQHQNNLDEKPKMKILKESELEKLSKYWEQESRPKVNHEPAQKRAYFKNRPFETIARLKK